MHRLIFESVTGRFEPSLSFSSWNGRLKAFEPCAII